MNILCSDSQHATRSASPGWRDVVAVGSVATDGMVCPACAAARQTAATDGTNLLNTVTIRKDGTISATKMRVISGEIVGSAQGQTTIVAGALSPAEQTSLQTLLQKLWDAAVP
jgi:hypothetical protein